MINLSLMGTVRVLRVCMNHQHIISANNALMGSGIIPPTNKGHALLFHAHLIDVDGHPRDIDTLRQAMEFVLNPRF